MTKTKNAKVKRKTLVDTNMQNNKDNIESVSDVESIDATFTKMELLEIPDDIRNFDRRVILERMMNFKTLQSKCIKTDIMHDALGRLDRCETLLTFAEFVPANIARSIENGLFEYTLVKLSTDPNYSPEFIKLIYREKAKDLLSNLDPNNPRVKNKTLLPNVINKKFTAYYLAFLRPEQLHPERWIKEIRKKKRIEEYNSEIKVTTLYECFKCNNKKCITNQIQMRSADEPATIFVTCTVCYNTFTK